MHYSRLVLDNVFAQHKKIVAVVYCNFQHSLIMVLELQLLPRLSEWSQVLLWKDPVYYSYMIDCIALSGLSSHSYKLKSDKIYKEF